MVKVSKMKKKCPLTISQSIENKKKYTLTIGQSVENKKSGSLTNSQSAELMFSPNSAIEQRRMNLIQAFSPPKKVRMSIYPTLAG